MIRVTAASVRITATIAVPTSKTADQVQTSLTSTLGTAKDASTALEITVEEVPTITVESDMDESDDLNVPLIVGIAIASALVVSAGVMMLWRQQQNALTGGPATRDLLNQPAAATIDAPNKA